MPLSAEAEPLRRAAARAIEVIPAGRALGAEVRGVDLRSSTRRRSRR